VLTYFLLSTNSRHWHWPASTLDESSISERSITEFTEKTVWMPASVHCLDDSTNDELLCST